MRSLSQVETRRGGSIPSWILYLSSFCVQTVLYFLRSSEFRNWTFTLEQPDGSAATFFGMPLYRNYLSFDKYEIHILFEFTGNSQLEMEPISLRHSEVTKEQQVLIFIIYRCSSEPLQRDAAVEKQRYSALKTMSNKKFISFLTKNH